MASVPPPTMVMASAETVFRKRSITPPLKTVSLVTVALVALTSCVPCTSSPMACPETVSKPPELMTEPESVPLMMAVPLEPITARMAVPPASTRSEPPLVMRAPELVEPPDTMTVAPDVVDVVDVPASVRLDPPEP
jgi:hypothetical protein